MTTKIHKTIFIIKIINYQRSNNATKLMIYISQIKNYFLTKKNA